MNMLRVSIRSEMGYVLWKIAVLLGVWVTGARAFSCYWVCG